MYQTNTSTITTSKIDLIVLLVKIKCMKIVSCVKSRIEQTPQPLKKNSLSSIPQKKVIRLTRETFSRENDDLVFRIAG